MAVTGGEKRGRGREGWDQPVNAHKPSVKQLGPSITSLLSVLRDIVTSFDFQVLIVTHNESTSIGSNNKVDFQKHCYGRYLVQAYRDEDWGRQKWSGVHVVTHRAWVVTGGRRSRREGVWLWSLEGSLSSYWRRLWVRSGLYMSWGLCSCCVPKEM